MTVPFHLHVRKHLTPLRVIKDYVIDPGFEIEGSPAGADSTGAVSLRDSLSRASFVAPVFTPRDRSAEPCKTASMRLHEPASLHCNDAVLENGDKKNNVMDETPRKPNKLELLSAEEAIPPKHDTNTEVRRQSSSSPHLTSPHLTSPHLTLPHLTPLTLDPPRQTICILLIIFNSLRVSTTASHKCCTPIPLLAYLSFGRHNLFSQSCKSDYAILVICWSES